jgi:hypothetical protein
MIRNFQVLEIPTHRGNETSRAWTAGPDSNIKRKLWLIK